MRPEYLSSGHTGNKALRRYYGVSKYSRFRTKNSVGLVLVSECE
jgi:hypothetical protein